MHYVQHNHPNIHSASHVLQNASMLARYQSHADIYNQFQREDVTEQIVGNRFSAVERYVQEQFQPPA